MKGQPEPPRCPSLDGSGTTPLDAVKGRYPVAGTWSRLHLYKIRLFAGEARFQMGHVGRAKFSRDATRSALASLVQRSTIGAIVPTA